MARLNRILGVAGLFILTAILAVFLYFTWRGLLAASFVSAVVTSMLVLVTGSSVFLTLLLLEENQIARRREFKPSLTVYLEPVAIGLLDVVIENIGNGPARDIGATLILLPDGIEWEFRRQNLRPGDKAPAFAPIEDAGFDLNSAQEYDMIAIEGECTDIFGGEIQFSDSYDMDLLYSGEHNQHLPYEERLERKVDNVAKNLKDINKTLKRETNKHW